MTFRSGLLPKRLFPFRVNWNTRVQEDLVYRTNVLRSYNGDEQRRRLRHLPRPRYTFNITTANEELANLRHAMYGWMQNEWYVPIVNHTSTLNSSVLAGSTVLLIDTVDKAYEDSKLMAIYNGHDNYSVVEILSHTNTSVTLTTGLSDNWDEGTIVFPVGVGYLSSFESAAYTDQVAVGSVTVECNPELTPLNLPTFSSVVTHTSLEGNIYDVITKPWDWSDQVPSTFTKVMDRVDTGIGPTAGFEVEESGQITTKVSWLCNGRAEISLVRSFVDSRSGMFKAFYVPSDINELTLAADYDNLFTAIDLADTYYASNVSDRKGYDAIYVKLTDGTLLMSNIVTVNVLGDITQITLDNAFSQTFTLDEVVQCGILQLCTFATDTINFEWLTDSVARVNVAIKTTRG